MKHKEGEKVKIKKTYLHKEIAGKEVIIDRIDEGYYGDAYFIEGGGSYYEVDDDDVEISDKMSDNDIINDIPESVREKIRKMLEEATKNIDFPEPLKSMLVQICYEMYKAGWKDAYRLFSRTIEVQKDLFFGTKK